MPLLNNKGTDPNKLLPIKYPWARKHYKNGVANNWTPEEVSMQQDIEQWKKPGFLSEHEKHLILRNLGFFSTAESLTANNIVLAVYKHITDPGCRQYLLRQAYEEALHSDVFVYVCDSLALPLDDIYGAYESIPSIKAKDDFVVGITQHIMSPDFTTKTIEGIQGLIHDLVGYYIIMEGLFFYAGFAMMLNFQRQNKMVGIAEQFHFVLKDESLHLAFGADLTNTIIAENPQAWTPELKQKLTENIMHAVELEVAYAEDCLPRGIKGMNATLMRDYLQYIADRRLERIGLEKQYGTVNPFPWMSEIMDLKKEKNFFETRVTEYQGEGDLEW